MPRISINDDPVMNDIEIQVAFSSRDLRELRPDLSPDSIRNIFNTCLRQFDPNVGLTLDVIYNTAEEMFPSIDLPSPQETVEREYIEQRPSRGYIIGEDLTLQGVIDRNMREEAQRRELQHANTGITTVTGRIRPIPNHRYPNPYMDQIREIERRYHLLRDIDSDF